jgi:predicted TPR repeat methyltransferase
LTPSDDLLNQALAHHAAGRLADAEAIYRRLLQDDPNQAVPMHMLGVVAHQAGNNDLAVDLIGQALVLQPDYANAHYNLGNALKDLGRPHEAVAAYQQSLAQNPSSADGHFNLANVLADLGELDQAVACFAAAIALQPDYGAAHFNMGNALKGLGRMEDAVAAYKSALAIPPASAEVHHNLGLALHQLGRMDQAIASYRAALAIQPEFTAAHYNLGKVLMSEDRSIEAIASFEHVLKRATGDDRTGAELALAHLGVMDPPATTPASFIKSYYQSRVQDWSNADWDKDAESYQGYEILSKILNFEGDRTDLAILDAGCGTGTLATLLRPYARHLEGVDLSPDMVEKARKKDLYDTLIEDDLEHYLSDGQRRFDRVVAAAVLVHFSRLDQIFAKFHRVLNPDGTLALTLFVDDDCEKFSVNVAGFFSHNPAYAIQAATDAGLTLIAQERGVHEVHGTTDIIGVGLLFQK